MTIATALGAVAVVAILNLVMMLMRQQSSGQDDIRAQVGAMSAARLAERDMRQTTYLVLPSASGTPSFKLEGCSNAAVAPGGSAPTALDAAQPVRGFAYCTRSGAAYYHTSASCPIVYNCGEGGTIVAGSEGGKAVASLTFIRPSAASALIEGDVTVASGDATMTTRVSAVAAFAPGSAP